MNISNLIRSMAAAGAPPEAIAIAVEAIEQVQGLIEEKRAAAREKKRRQRAAASDCPGTVPGHGGDMEGTTPVLNKEKSPIPPKEIKPTPGGVTGALARKAGGFGPPVGVSLHSWNALCQQRKKALTEIAYGRMCKTLAEGAEAGWPPGELVDRSIERGYETVFIPKERRNGNAGRSSAPERVDGFAEALREMGNVQQFAHRGYHDG